MRCAQKEDFSSGSESDTLSPESVLPVGPDAELTPSAGESADFRRAEAPIVGAITASIGDKLKLVLLPI
jgi:hypothetical protein